MGACDGCGRVLLVLINIIFACIGILMLVIGCVVKYGRDAMSDILDDWYTRFKQALEEAGVVDTSFEDFDIEEFLSDTAIIFIVVGVFFIVLGIVGCLGACLKNRACLIIYTIIVVFIILIELTCVILLFALKDEIKDWLKEPLHDAIEDDYVGINGTDGVTLGLNFIMSEGCYEAIEDWVIDNQDILIGSGSGVAAVEIILVLCACIVCVKKRKPKTGYERHV